VGEKSNKVSVFLIRSQFTDRSAIVEEGAETLELGGVGTFYTEKSFVRPPDWVTDFFGTEIAGKFTILTASARGLLLVEATAAEANHIFAITFGHGRHLLRDDVFEERFGLKVVLNSVARDSLRSIDKTTLGSLPKQSREQMSREGEAANFGIDIEQDLVSSVTGRSKVAMFGKIITGRDALTINAKITSKNVSTFLPEFLTRYESDDYKAEFDWIDQIKDVRDAITTDSLNTWLVDQLKAGHQEKIWMAPPGVVDWVSVKGFRYGLSKKATIYDDLRVADFLAESPKDQLSIDTLRSKRVYALSSKTDLPIESWNCFRCFYAETSLNGQTYVLNNGKWYVIEQEFAERVLKEFADFPQSQLELPKYAHKNEEEYNKATSASIVNSVCLDRDLIPHGGGHSLIEFCDIKTQDNRFVHVKHYSGSAQLSHLFNQGLVSGELFVQDAEFRAKVNAKLPAGHKLADINERPNAADYEVVYAVISQSKSPLDIPFFSKVSLRNARRRLRGYGFKVTLRKVERDAA
jgi:uncharacterized protein (TIGR04141 family)